jgi:hypothetical protein
MISGHTGGPSSGGMTIRRVPPRRIVRMPSSNPGDCPLNESEIAKMFASVKCLANLHFPVVL